MPKHDLNSLPKSLAEARKAGSNIYYTGVHCKNSHLTYRYVADRICSACVMAKVAKLSTVGGGNARRWAAKTKEQLSVIYEKRKKYYEKTKEKIKEEKRKSYEKLKQDPVWLENKRRKTKEYREKFGRKKDVSNPEVKKRYKQTLNGKTKARANDAKRRAELLRRTPSWLTEEDFWMIEQSYELAQLRSKLFGFAWHVDHIIPLQGKTVSGLHVPQNLQVIPWIDNVKKANRYLPA